MIDAVDNTDTLYAPGGEPVAPEVPVDTVPNLRPNGDWMLIRRLLPMERTKGGLILPTHMKGQFFRAEVLRKGRGLYEDGEWVFAVECEIGDVVLVKEDPPADNPRFQGIPRNLISVSPDDSTYLLCPGHNVYAVEIPNRDTRPPLTEEERAELYHIPDDPATGVA